jgi:phage tail-like protein
MYRELTVRVGDQIVLISTMTRPVWTIGRLPDNDLPLQDAAVSSHHAEIRVEPQGVIFTDLGSEGGSTINGARVLALQPTPLKDGAIIEIGPYTIVYKGTEGEHDIPAVASTEAAPVISSSAIPVRAPQRMRRTMEINGPGSTARLSNYLQYLPIIFHENDFLNRYLQIFESIWELLEQRQDHITMYFDPRTCPLEFLPWFAGWFGLSLDPHSPEMQRRQLLSEAIDLYRWRGTQYGMTRMIEICTGAKAEIADIPSQPFVFRIRVRLPDGSGVTSDDLEELIRTHKPAHTGYFLEVL